MIQFEPRTYGVLGSYTLLLKSLHFVQGFSRLSRSTGYFFPRLLNLPFFLVCHPGTKSVNVLFLPVLKNSIIQIANQCESRVEFVKLFIINKIDV